MVCRWVNTHKGTGAGVFGPRTKYLEPMGKYPSILNNGYRKQDIAILTDSQAAMVWECLGKFNELDRNNKVTLLWVSGHRGIAGNEELFCQIEGGTRKSQALRTTHWTDTL